jgi:hypothetical protein
MPAFKTAIFNQRKNHELENCKTIELSHLVHTVGIALALRWLLTHDAA